MNPLKIAICGCGNGAHACAGLLSSKGHDIRIYSPIKEEIESFRNNYENRKLKLIKEETDYNNLEITQITSNPKEAISDASIIFIIVPAFAHRDILKQIKPYINENSLIAIIPGRSGLEFEIKKIIPKANVLIFQTLPWACRTKEFGSSVEIKGTKNEVQVASMPANINDIFINQVEDLLEIGLKKVKNCLTLTFSNVGQIIHPGIMYGIFKDNHDEKFSEENIPLFYQNVDEETAKLLSNMSKEIISVATEINKVFNVIDINQVLSIEEWIEASYEGNIVDKSNLKTMFNSNKAYQGLKVPMRKLKDGYYVADFNNRYITEDVPYGILIVKSISQILNISTPSIDEVITNLGKWRSYDYMEMLRNTKNLSKQSRIPEVFGYDNIEDIAGLG